MTDIKDLPWSEEPVQDSSTEAIEVPKPVNQVRAALLADEADYQAKKEYEARIADNAEAYEAVIGGKAPIEALELAATSSEDYEQYISQEELEAIPAPSDEDGRAAPEGLIALYTPPKRPHNPDWRRELTNAKGKPWRSGDDLDAESIVNLDLFLKNHENYSDMFMYDEFAHEKKVCRCPPWEIESSFWPHALRDEDITGLAMDLHRNGLDPGFDKIRRVLNVVIKSASRHPAREYFTSLKWDGVKRLDGWLAKYCGATYDDPEYLRAVGSKWLIAAVARVFQPGCKFDHILILEGAQNAGKSRLLKELATIRDRAYFDDTISVKDLGNPATVPKLQGVLIIEFAELSGIRVKDVNELKQAITITSDRIVQKWSNEATYFPRQFVFAGSTNNSQYLVDPTGNRRFWPVKTKKIDIESLQRDKEQIWAEAVVRYEAGEKLYLEGKLYKAAQIEQEKRRTSDPWLEPLEQSTEGKKFISTEEIWLLLVSEKSKQTHHMQERIAGVMTALGFERGTGRDLGKQCRGWKRIDTAEEPEEPTQEEISWPIKD